MSVFFLLRVAIYVYWRIPTVKKDRDFPPIELK